MQLLYIPNVIFLNTCLKPHYIEKEVSLKLREGQFLPKCRKSGDCQTRNSWVLLRLSLTRMQTAAEDKTQEGWQRESLQGGYCQEIEKLGYPIQTV
ncbi:unnamed protein product [Gulo gulo]|uniref:Uncharacterized protein n=1 Tax=Gulo gulo TaxID=48420 RepID=A0A9X9M4F3_GULGU|nr:unnamed protein product [Gulo gulo]